MDDIIDHRYALIISTTQYQIPKARARAIVARLKFFSMLFFLHPFSDCQPNKLGQGPLLSFSERSGLFSLFVRKPECVVIVLFHN